MSFSLAVIGLGPAGLDRVGDPALSKLTDGERIVILRTLHHPAAAELSALRAVTSCDDLYDSADGFGDLYGAIGDRVLEAAKTGPVTYAVPGSALVGERSVTVIRDRALAGGQPVELIPGESFLDLVFDRAGIDPIHSGLQILDARDLPDPLPLHVPTVITQVDRAGVLGDVAIELGRVLPGATEVVVLERLGGADEVVEKVALDSLVGRAAGPLTTLFLDPPPAGFHGLVTTNRRLRSECPWDREQTHHSLVSHLVEEAYETVDALSRLGPAAPAGNPDLVAYHEVEEELGDLLLQVVFHATLAAEAGAFGVEEVAESVRRKLVHRHPHVFGDVAADSPGDVIANWEHLKAAEKKRSSLMDDIPTATPAISRADKIQRRAASVGFDWDAVEPVIAKVREEIDEVDAARADPERAAAELGDLLFAAVNLARHLEVDAELALRQAAESFSERFRAVEGRAAAGGRDLAAMSLAEMDALWDEVKSAEHGRDPERS